MQKGEPASFLVRYTGVKGARLLSEIESVRERKNKTQICAGKKSNWFSPSSHLSNSRHPRILSCSLVLRTTRTIITTPPTLLPILHPPPPLPPHHTYISPPQPPITHIPTSHHTHPLPNLPSHVSPPQPPITRIPSPTSHCPTHLLITNQPFLPRQIYSPFNFSVSIYGQFSDPDPQYSGRPPGSGTRRWKNKTN